MGLLTMTPADRDELYMRMALDEARMAADEGEVPVGAVIVIGDKVIARCHNRTEALHDVTAHAEMLAITAAAEYLNGKYLDKCSLYVTVEPCAMCAGALGWSQISEVIYGATDNKRGFHTLYITPHGPFHPRTSVRSGVLEDECAGLMKSFFKSKR